MRIIIILLIAFNGFSQGLLPGYSFWFRPDGLSNNSDNSFGTVTDSGFVTSLKSISGAVTATQTIYSHRPVFTTTTTLGSKKRNCIRNFVNDGLLFNDHTMTKNKTGLTFYAVLNCNTPNSNSDRYGILLFLDANGDRSRFGLNVDPGTAGYIVKGRRTDTEFSATSALTYGKSIFQGDVIVCIKADYSTGVLSIYTNGVLTSSAVSTSTGATSNTDGLYDALGNYFAYAPSTYYGYVGYYGDVAFYPVAHTDDQIKENCKRLDNYYGIYKLYKPIYDYDPEVKALVTTYTTAPTTAQKDLLNNFVSGVKSDLGIPTLSVNFDLLYLTANYNQQAANINLSKPEYSITPVGSPNWATTGYTGATNKYLRLGLTPSTSTLNALSKWGEFGCYLKNNISEDRAALGSASNSTTFRTVLWPRWSDGKTYIYANNCAPTGTTQATSAGLTSCQYGVITTTGGTSQVSMLYLKNADKYGEAIYNCSAISPFELYGLCKNEGGTPLQFSTNEASCFYWGRPIYTPKFYNRLLTYLTAYGAN